MLTNPPASLPKRGRKRRDNASVLTAESECLPALLEAAHIGIDEAGRGCLAGPVVAAAVYFPAAFAHAQLLPGLADSKQLSEVRRNELAPLIIERVPAYGIGLAWQEEIDRVNILNASLRAMARAAQSLAAVLAGATVPCLIIDGNKTISEDHWNARADAPSAEILEWERCLAVPPLRLQQLPPPVPEQYALIKGDSLAASVSAASILAKTLRDSLMLHLAQVFPVYGFERHKGYGTKDHRACLAKFGPCPLHRRTFRGATGDVACNTGDMLAFPDCDGA